VIHQQHNDVKQIHEKHYEFYVGGVAVRDDRQRDASLTAIEIPADTVLGATLLPYGGGLEPVRKTGPRSNKIKQMQKQKHRRHTIQERHRFTWFTQCGLRPPEKLPCPSFIIIQQMKGCNLQQNPL
jgi:hypothetical protein